MKNSAQKRAVQNYRERLGRRGLARFEVVGLDSDRELIRQVARKLSENDAEAARLRGELGSSVKGEPVRRGGILAALRRSPLVGEALNIERETGSGRDVDL
jgi:hypothetical protein